MSNESSSAPSTDWFDLNTTEPSTPFPFTPDLIQSIQTQRDILSGTLFIDEMLSLAGLDTIALDFFPPTSPAALVELLHEIDASEWEQLRRDCLYYYLLKFWRDEEVEAGECRAKKYASSKLIPDGFTILADAYFYLDDGDSSRAVRCLTDPRVQPDFVPKIMHTLSVSSQPELVLRFVRLAKPLLTDIPSLEIYIGALCTDSIVDALFYARNFPESIDEGAQRPRLLGMILNSSLIPKPRHAPLNTLLTFPLTQYEQTVLNTYALRPPPSLPDVSLALLQDLITTRLIHQGKYSDAITLDRLFVAAGINGASSGEGSGDAVRKAADARRGTFREILAVLPDIQRRLLELALDDKQASSSAGAPLPPQRPIQPTSNSHGDLNMSWEELERSDPSRVPRTPSKPTFTGPPQQREGLQTPLSASVAFRTAANPKVAVLRAFAQQASASASSPARTSVAPSSPVASNNSSRLVLARSTSSKSGAGGAASVFSDMSTEPFAVSSPFTAKHRLAYTPLQPRIRPPLFASVSSKNGDVKPNGIAKAGAAKSTPPPVVVHRPQLPSSTSWGDVFPPVSKQSRVSHPAATKQPSMSRNSAHPPSTSLNNPDEPTTLTAKLNRGWSSASDQQPQHSALSSSIFGSRGAAAQPTEPVNEQEHAFKPSHALHRTPFAKDSRNGAGGVASVARARLSAPPAPTMLFGQSTTTPTKATKKRPREEHQQQQDLWNNQTAGVGANGRVEFIGSSDDEDEVFVRPLSIVAALRRSIGSQEPPSDQRGRVRSHSHEEAREDQEEDMEMLDSELRDVNDESEHLEEREDAEDDADEEEATAMLLHKDERSELPGAFPHHANTMTSNIASSSLSPPPQQHSATRSPSANRKSRSADPEAIDAELRPLRPTQPDAAKPPRAKKSVSRRPSKPSTRAPSVISEGDSEEDDEHEQESKPSRNLRRSSRLSAAPSDSEPPKSKRMRSATASPPRDGATKLRGKKGRGASGPPPAISSSRITRRQASVLENVEE